jgi:beta-catenin-like protein 1
VESNYEKVDRLLDIREGAEARLKVADKEIEREKRVSGHKFSAMQSNS